MRKSRGLTQKAVAGSVPTYYSDNRSYRRIENEGQMPDREALLAVLVEGLKVTDEKTVNEVLSLADYTPVTPAEAHSHRLELSPAIAHPPNKRTLQTRWLVANRKALKFLPEAMMLGAVAVSTLLATVSRHGTFIVASTILYGCLYLISLLLESTLDPNPAEIWPTTTAIFCLVNVSSSTALALDAWLANRFGLAVLWLTLSIFLGGAAAQWMIGKGVLSELPVVPMELLRCR